MHANGNQIMEGKVLDEQVKIRILRHSGSHVFV